MTKNVFEDLFPHSPKKAADLLKRSELIMEISKTVGRPLGDSIEDFILFSNWKKIKALGELLTK